MSPVAAAHAGRVRFDGWIAGLGTAAGTRIVLGHWLRSPFGSFSDVMVEDLAGRRTLLAAEPAASFIAETYLFDEVQHCAVEVTVAGVDDATARERWQVAAGPLRVGFSVGRRAALGWLLRGVPAPLAAAPPWVQAIDLPARLLPGVRATGSARPGRREWYGVRDLHLIADARAVWDGTELGGLSYVRPPVRFGFGSVPARPGLVRVITTVQVDG